MTLETVSALEPVVRAREDVNETRFFGCQTWIRATSVTTSVGMGIFEQIGAPGLGSPYHVHRNEDESFYIIEGQLRFVSGDRSWVAGPGSFAFLPRDVPHGFEIVGEPPARFLILVTSGGFGGFGAELCGRDPRFAARVA